jgi:hypothetical protein
MLLPRKCCRKCIHSHSAAGHVMYVECRNKDHLKETGITEKYTLERDFYRCVHYKGRAK